MPASSARIALDQFTTFGDMLKYLRRRAGLTQRELSIAVGYSEGQISRLEQNERMPDLATLIARFIPALFAEDDPEVAARLLELAAAIRREDAPAAGLPPYKGLYYFDEADAELFFGREQLTETLVDHVMTRVHTNERFLAVVGASGSGKSSVVRAGLIPTLRWRQPSSGWPVYVITPTAHPLDNLAGNLLGETQRDLPLRKLVDLLAQSPLTLHSHSKRIAEEAGASQVLLVIDQFEESFTLCRSEAEQSAFVENLLTAAFQPEGAAIVIVVLRADFYAHCARFNLLRQALTKSQEYLGPMTTDELRRAIEEPARRGHWELEQGLVEFLLHDVGAEAGHAPEPGALPLLSHALLATWQRRRGHRLTLSGYSASGGVRGAIAETAEAVFHDHLAPEQRAIARQIFLRLTELGDDTAAPDTRRRVSFEELASTPEDRDPVHEVLMTLADARLIITDQDSAEVAHEALIREWPTLRNWLEEDREALRLHRHVTDAAQEWELLDRDPGVLYRGARLAQAMEWSRAHESDLNLLERSFLEASRSQADQDFAEREAQRQRELEAAHQLAEHERARAEEQTKSNRQLRQRAFYLFVAFFIVGMLAVVAFGYGRRATRAEHLALSRELAAASGNNLQIDPERSVLLALQAIESMDTLEAQNALHRALPEIHSIFTLTAHAGGAVDVAFNPDGSRIASIGEDGTAKIWDAPTGQLLEALHNDSGETSSSVAYSPDGKILVTAWLTQVIFWDAESYERLFTLSGQNVGTEVGYNLGVGQVSFNPDGSLLAIANLDGESVIWDLASHTKRLTIKHEGQPAKAIAFSPDGLLLATGGDEGVVRLWDSGSADLEFALTMGGVIHRVAFCPNDSRIAAASENGSVKVWDARTGEELLTLPRLSGLYSIAFLSNGTLVTAGQDGTARLWDSESGQQLLTLAGHRSTVVGVAGSPDGNRIASSGYDDTVRIWDAAPGRELLTIAGHQDIVWDVEYSPDGKQIASASVDGTAILWEVDSGQLLLTLSDGDAPTDGFTGLSFSPDGEQLATGSMDGTITLWDSQTGDILNTLEGHSNMVVGLAFSPDGAELASASWDGTAKVWDVSTGRVVVTFVGHETPVLLVGIAFSPDGKSVFTAGDDDYVRMWDAATGQELRAFSGNGKDIYGLALSSMDDLLAMGDQDGVITLWDINTGDIVRTFGSHAGLIFRLEFSRDGTRLASASFDRLAKIWDVTTGEEVARLFGNTGSVFGVSFSPDGDHLATAGADGTIRTYTLRTDELINLALSRVSRTLTEVECQLFLHEDSCAQYSVRMKIHRAK